MNAAQALELAARELPQASEAERHFVIAVTGFESNWGQGWVHLAQKLGVENPEQFAALHNWGAVTARDPAKGGKVPAMFLRDRFWRQYPDDAAGLRDAAFVMLKPNVKAALARGDGFGAVHGMAVNGYYIEPGMNAAQKKKTEDDYRRNVEAKYSSIIKATGAPRLLDFEPSKGRSIGDALIGLTFVAGLVSAIVKLRGKSE